MKIYFDQLAIKNKYEKQMKDRFPDILFVSQIEGNTDAEAIITMPGFLKAEQLDQFSDVKWVHLLTAGYDKIDLNYFLKREKLTLLPKYANQRG
ncbi:MAG: hypothetical protein CVV58_07480 [Tenericutes bacterium HGW-Tenericutes-3]|nr:MAG: hypothetical protein CVV58_07480 [Tenericutes bacterium HGW-Tenericutes-3]